MPETHPIPDSRQSGPHTQVLNENAELALGIGLIALIGGAEKPTICDAVYGVRMRVAKFNEAIVGRMVPTPGSVPFP